MVGVGDVEVRVGPGEVVRVEVGEGEVVAVLGEEVGDGEADRSLRCVNRTVQVAGVPLVLFAHVDEDRSLRRAEDSLRLDGVDFRERLRRHERPLSFVMRIFCGAILVALRGRLRFWNQTTTP